jgi:hypothetical protein
LVCAWPILAAYAPSRRRLRGGLDDPNPVTAQKLARFLRPSQTAREIAPSSGATRLHADDQPDRRKSPRKLRPSAPLASQFLKQADMFPQGSIERNASQRRLQSAELIDALPKPSRVKTIHVSNCHVLTQNVTPTAVHLELSAAAQLCLLQHDGIDYARVEHAVLPTSAQRTAHDCQRPFPGPRSRLGPGRVVHNRAAEPPIGSRAG